MNVAVFSTRPYDRESLELANESSGHELSFFEARLDVDTAILAEGSQAVCAFVNDELDRATLEKLVSVGVELVALRSAGFNHVDLEAAHALDVVVARVPAYSPHAVAEHAVGLILTLNRRLHRAFNRVREGNFALEGLRGFDLRGRTVGVVGTGAIGGVFARIMAGFGCRLLGFDPAPDPACRELGMRYVTLEELFSESDIISLHCPLHESTYHLIDHQAVELMKPGVMVVNTGRGALIDTRAVIDGLKQGKIGHLALDVYEEEEELFFMDRSAEIIQDDVFMRLLTFPNVLVTAHQGFFTEEALANIAETTLANITAYETGQGPLHRVDPA